MDRGDEIVAVGADEPLGEIADPAAVLIDVVGDGRQFGGGRFDGSGHVGTVPLGGPNPPGAAQLPSVGFAA